jgi:arginine/lysine/histidine transport system ATP-binding protein
MLKASHLHKSFQQHVILNDISFEIPMGSVAALLGPSGSGKSTLLRCISRLESLESGTIHFQDKPIAALAPYAIGMVFQGFHLFPHLTVLQNLIHAPVSLKHMTKSQATNEALALLEMFGLADKGKQFPNQLSGGQKQRVAIARALIVKPPILLFDEPTSALDPEMVSEVASLIRGLKSKDRLIIMATHELRAAQLACDQILFLDHGVLVENASNKNFFNKPKSKRAQQFIKNLTIA